MKTERPVSTYRGGAAQRWHRLSGKGRSRTAGVYDGCRAGRLRPCLIMEKRRETFFERARRRHLERTSRSWGDELARDPVANVISESSRAYGDDFAFDDRPRPNEASNWTEPSATRERREQAGDWSPYNPTGGTGGAFRGRRPAYGAAAEPRARWRREPLTVGEIMTRNVRTASPEDDALTLARTMRDDDCGVLPVIDERRRVLGVVTDRDLVVRGERIEGQKARDLMSRDVECVRREERIQVALELMARRHVRRVPVVDEEDRLVGLVSMSDVATRADLDQELRETLQRLSARRSFWRGL